MMLLACEWLGLLALLALLAIVRTTPQRLIVSPEGVQRIPKSEHSSVPPRAVKRRVRGVCTLKKRRDLLTRLI